MNTKQIVAVILGLVAVAVTLILPGNRPKSEVVSSRQVTPNMSMTVIVETVPKAGLLGSAAITALTLGSVYWLRTRRSA